MKILFSIFFRNLNGGSIRLIGIILMFNSFREINAQLVPAFCNESPGVKWVSYMDWIKPSASVTNGLVFSLQKYNLGSMALNATAILTNTHNLTSTGNVSFILSDRVGNSCLKEKSISLRNPVSCSTQLVKISGQFGMGGNPLPNPGHITLDGQLYKYQSSNGDVHSFKREGLNEILVIHIKKAQVN